MSKWDWSLAEWRDYYYKLMTKAERNYQETGESRYDRERLKYDIIVGAMDKAIEFDDERDNDRLRRMRNIDAYYERYGSRDSFTKAEVDKIVRDIRGM